MNKLMNRGKKNEQKKNQIRIGALLSHFEISNLFKSKHTFYDKVILGPRSLTITQYSIYFSYHIWCHGWVIKWQVNTNHSNNNEPKTQKTLNIFKAIHLAI